MKSIAIMVFMFLTLTVGAKAQENQRIFTAEEQAIVDLSHSKMGLDGREKRREAGGTVSRELAIRPHGRLLGQTRGVEYHPYGRHLVQESRDTRRAGEVRGRNGNPLQPYSSELGSRRQCRALPFYCYGGICNGKRPMAALYACLYENFR